MPPGATFNVERLTLPVAATAPGVSSTDVKWSHTEGPLVMTIQHVASRVRITIARPSLPNKPIVSCTVNRLSSGATDSNAAKVILIPMGIACRYPSSFPGGTNLHDRFQARFISAADSPEVAKLLAPYFQLIKPTTAAGSQASQPQAGASQPAPKKKTVPAKRKTGEIGSDESQQVPVKQRKIGTRAPEAIIAAPAAEPPTLPNQVTPSIESPPIASPSQTQDLYNAIKADLLRYAAEQKTKAESSSSTRPASPITPAILSASQKGPTPSTPTTPAPPAPAIDLLPRSPLVDISEYAPLPAPAVSSVVGELLDLDPSHFTPNPTFDSIYPPIYTDAEVQHQEMALRADQALYDGQSSATQVSAIVRGSSAERLPSGDFVEARDWRKWSELDHDGLYQAVAYGGIPVELYELCMRVAHYQAYLTAHQTEENWRADNAYRAQLQTEYGASLGIQASPYLEPSKGVPPSLPQQEQVFDDQVPQSYDSCPIPPWRVPSQDSSRPSTLAYHTDTLLHHPRPHRAARFQLQDRDAPNSPQAYTSSSIPPSSPQCYPSSSPSTSPDPGLNSSYAPHSHFPDDPFSPLVDSIFGPDLIDDID